MEGSGEPELAEGTGEGSSPVGDGFLAYGPRVVRQVSCSKQAKDQSIDLKAIRSEGKLRNV